MWILLRLTQKYSNQNKVFFFAKTGVFSWSLDYFFIWKFEDYAICSLCIFHTQVLWPVTFFCRMLHKCLLERLNQQMVLVPCNWSGLLNQEHHLVSGISLNDMVFVMVMATYELCFLVRCGSYFLPMFLLAHITFLEVWLIFIAQLCGLKALFAHSSLWFLWCFS